MDLFSFFAGSFLCHGEVLREFNSTDGRSLFAEILQYNNKNHKIQLKCKNGKKVWVSPSIFSDGDKNYIKEWVNAESFRSSRSLMISARKESENKNTLRYKITLSNKCDADFTDLLIDYRIHIEEKGSNSYPDDSRVIGEVLGPVSVPARDSVILYTDNEKLVDYSESFTVWYTDSTGLRDSDTVVRKQREDHARGLLIRLHGPKVGNMRALRTCTQPDNLSEKKYAWTEEFIQPSLHRKARPYKDKINEKDRAIFKKAHNAFNDGRHQDALAILADRENHLDCYKLTQLQLYLFSDETRDLKKAKEIVENVKLVRWPPSILYHYYLSWFLSTCSDETLHDGVKARRHAETAINGYEQGYARGVKFLESKLYDTLAAAHARKGSFDTAVKREEEAIQLAKKSGSPYLRDYIDRLELYKKGKPYSAEEYTINFEYKLEDEY